MRWAAPVVFVSLILAVAPGCGGGGSSSTTANLRFVQGSPDAPPVDFLVGGTTETSNMLYGNASSYVSVKAGTVHVQVIPVNSTKPLLDQSVSLAGSANETLFLTGPVTQLKPLVLNDGVTTSTTATTNNVRVVNISTQMGPADVYIVAPGVNLASATAVSSGLAFDQSTSYTALTQGGNYEVYMTVPGGLTVYLATGPLTFATKLQQTVVVEDAPAGGFTFSVLDDQ